MVVTGLTVGKRTDAPATNEVRNRGMQWGAVLEVLITKRCQTKWEWRVCDRHGATIMSGFESTRRVAKYRGYRALFLV